MKDNDVLVKILNMVKIIVVLLAVILVILVIGVSKMYSTGENDLNNSDETGYNTEYDVSSFDEIVAGDIKKSTKNKTKVIFIGRESCGWCAAFLPNLWDAQDEYGFTTLYIDLAKIIDFSSNSITDQDAFDILSELTGDEYDGYMEENLGSTPMILVVKDNEIIKAQTGYSEYDTFKSMLDEVGL